MDDKIKKCKEFLIQQVLSDYFNFKIKTKDLIFENVIICVNNVILNKSGEIAKIFLSFYNSQEQKQMHLSILDKIKGQKQYIKKFLTEKISNKIRRIPDLIFYLDDSFEKFQKINKIIKENEIIK